MKENILNGSDHFFFSLKDLQLASLLNYISLPFTITILLDDLSKHIYSGEIVKNDKIVNRN